MLIVTLATVSINKQLRALPHAVAMTVIVVNIKTMARV